MWQQPKGIRKGNIAVNKEANEEKNEAPVKREARLERGGVDFALRFPDRRQRGEDEERSEAHRENSFGPFPFVGRKSLTPREGEPHGMLQHEQIRDAGEGEKNGRGNFHQSRRK